MAKKEQNAGTKVPHGASPKIDQKEGVYQAEYFGSGTFRIVKPKRNARKSRQSRLKGTTRGARK
jgi:hypothetical protein